MAAGTADSSWGSQLVSDWNVWLWVSAGGGGGSGWMLLALFLPPPRILTQWNFGGSLWAGPAQPSPAAGRRFLWTKRQHRREGKWVLVPGNVILSLLQARFWAIRLGVPHETPDKHLEDSCYLALGQVLCFRGLVTSPSIHQ